jgi:peptide/nickel transport system ATP-binding protein
MLVEAKDLAKTYKVGWPAKRRVPVLVRASLVLGRGETVGVVGESGSGKTTLGLLLSGLLKPDAGQVVFAGREITRLNGGERKEFRRRVQVVFQHPEGAFNPRWKLVESLSEPYRLHRLPFSPQALVEQLKNVGLGEEHLNRYPSELSGGELQRAAIVRAMALKPEFVVLDEPTSMLDTITQAQILRLLEEVQRQTGVAYLFITHDLELARLFCRRIYRLEKGVLTLENGGQE